MEKAEFQNLLFVNKCPLFLSTGERRYKERLSSFSCTIQNSERKIALPFTIAGMEVADPLQRMEIGGSIPS